MNEPIFSFTEEQLLGLIRKLLEAFKKILAWLGIFVLPDNAETTAPQTTENTTV